MANAGHTTPTGVRISGGYTPPAHRRRGYARALVAAASQGELVRGRSMCVLDADVTNGTATRLCESVGYVAVGDVEVYRFEPTSSTGGARPAAPACGTVASSS